MQAIILHGEKAISCKMTLQRLVTVLNHCGKRNITRERIMAYSFFRFLTISDVKEYTLFPYGSQAEEDHTVLGALNTMRWEKRQRTFLRKPGPNADTSLLYGPELRRILDEEVHVTIEKRYCTFSKRIEKKGYPPKWIEVPVHYAELGGKRGGGAGESKYGSLRAVRALLDETHKWSLNMPLEGDGHPAVKGNLTVDASYMGGIPNQRPLEDQETYLPGGRQLVAAQADGRQIKNQQKSTSVSMWVPSTGAGGGQSLRTVFPICEIARPEEPQSLRRALQEACVPEALAAIYRWEQRTEGCPPVEGEPNTLCDHCGLAKWQHCLRAFWLCDGCCLCNTMYEAGEPGSNWLGGKCQGCRLLINELANSWFNHRDTSHHRPRFGAFKNDLFPTLPRGRKAVCMLHGLEKIASWVLCVLHDYLSSRNDCAKALKHLRKWVNHTRTEAEKWTRETTIQHKHSKKEQKDTLVGGRTAKNMFMIGRAYQEDKKNQKRWRKLWGLLPRVEADIEVKEEGPDGKDRLKTTSVVGQDGVERRTAVTERVSDLLRDVLSITRDLLQMTVRSRVIIVVWQELAMKLQCRMVTSLPLRAFAMRYFCRHPSCHYALVHSMDSIREQNAAGDATEGRMLMMEVGEHTHQLHMAYASKACRHSPPQRCYDLLHIGLTLRGLAIRYGYVPVTFSSHASFHH